MIKLYVAVCFFLDITGGGHFEISARAYTTLGACDEFAQGYESEKITMDGVQDAWTQCLPIAGYAI